MVNVLRKPAGDPSSAWPAICIGIFAAFGGILYGYDTGTISGLQAMPEWQKQFGYPDSSQTSLIVSILSVGTFFGALSAGQIMDILGRKYGIMFAAFVPFNLGVALQTGASTRATFVAGRCFAGFGVGLISCQIPVYQAESLPKWIRGFVVGSYQFCITIGLLLASLVNYGTKNYTNTGAFRVPLGLQFAWSIIIVVGMFFLPETPRYLIKKGKDERAKESLKTLRRLPVDHPALIAEYQTIRAQHDYEISLGTSSYAECFRGSIGKRTLTGILLQCLQQLVGVNFIFYYGTSYFSTQKGLPNAFILSVITNVVNVFSTLPGLYAIDKFGRRPVLFFGALGMGICQYIVAACGDATSPNNASSTAAQFAFICIYIFFFAATWGPGAWVVTSEIFPLKTRAKCISMTTASNWLFNFVLSFIIPYLEDSKNGQYADLKSNVFWLWGSFCWISVVFVYFMIYETSAMTLEEVNDLYENVSSARKSSGYVRRQDSFVPDPRGAGMGRETEKSSQQEADEVQSEFKN